MVTQNDNPARRVENNFQRILDLNKGVYLPENVVKALWHRWANPIVSDFFDEYCFHCWGKTAKEVGVIHHVDYNGGYPRKEAEVVSLCKSGRILWLCRPCHTRIFKVHGHG